MVTIKKIKDISCELFHENKNESVGIIENEYSFHDVRVQIKKLQLNGYYVIWKGYKIRIDLEGNLEDWPNGFYDINSDLLVQLL